MHEDGSLQQSIIHSIGDGVLAFDRDCRYTHWNPAMERISGLLAADVLGKNAFEVFPFLREIGEDRCFAAALNGDTVCSERRGYKVPETGQSGYFEGNYSPLKNSAGEIIGGVSIIRDISARVEAEQKEAEFLAKEKGDQRFRALVDRVQNIIWAADESGQNIFTNRFGLEFTGMQGKHLNFDKWVPVLHPDEVNEVWGKWQAAFSEGRLFECQHRMKRADGMFRWVIARAVPIRNADGKVVEWVGTVTDIHEHVIASQRSVELQAISAELSSAVTPEEVAEILVTKGLIALGAKNGILALLTADRQSAEIFAGKGYSKELLKRWHQGPLGMNHPLTTAIKSKRTAFVHSLEHAREAYPIIVDDMISAGEQAHATLPLIVKNEVIGILSVGFAEPREIDAAEERFMHTLAGLCGQALERSRIYESERAARALAETANSAKSNFLATVSHELRTPLSSIIGYSELLLKPQTAPNKAAEFIRGIDRNGKVLIRLVDDILDLSKIEAGHLAVEKVEFHLASCLYEVMETLRLEASRKGIEFTFNQNAQLPRKVVTDPFRLRQILLNVVGNAVKFTESGAVEVTMTTETRDEKGHSQLVFSVEDTGVGVKDEFQNSLFQPFSQGQDSSGRKRGGTGLGLVIARKLARMLDGDVRLVSSLPDKGSIFEIRIGILEVVKGMETAREENPVRPNDEAISLKGARILVAEDAPDVQVIIVEMLTAQGASVDIAPDGQVAVEKALEGEYDLIIMDLQMPILNGHAATAYLRNSGYTQPIIALTANALSDLKDSLRGGFDAHLIKPIDSKIFLRTISDFVRRD